MEPDIEQANVVDVVDWPTEQPGTEPALLYAGVGRLDGPSST